jgi:hypothetical protein
MASSLKEMFWRRSERAERYGTALSFVCLVLQELKSITDL